MKKKSRERMGLCKLTGTYGRFVQSHLMPRALTKADGLGPGLVQLGNGTRQRRASSWYDPLLVTQEGEAILAEYDNWAVPFLRKFQLVWSGWGPMQRLPGADYTPRMLEGGDWKRLRMFLLSILWRAAASSLPEFREIDMPAGDQEFLREMIVSGKHEPVNFYPASLTQLSSVGILHNHAPLAMVKQIPSFEEDVPARDEPTFRFYMDGLIVHFSRLGVEENEARDLGPLIVGGDESLVVSTVPFELSAQAENLAIVGLEAELGRPLFEIEHGPFSPERRIFK